MATSPSMDVASLNLASPVLYAQVDAYLKNNRLKFVEVFNANDKNKDGVLDINEISNILRQFVGNNAPQAEIDALTARLANEHAGKISCDAFLDYLARTATQTQHVAPVQPAAAPPPPTVAVPLAPPAPIKEIKSPVVPKPKPQHAPRSFDELVDKLDAWLQNNETHLQQLFKQADKDGSGSLSIREADALCREFLGGAIKTLGNSAKDYIDECVALLDLDGDGQITYAEMGTVIKSCWGKAESTDVTEEEIVARIRSLVSRYEGGLSAIFAKHANTGRGLNARALMQLLKSLYGVDIVGTHGQKNAFRGELRHSFAVLQRRCDRDHDGFVTYFELREAIYGDKRKSESARLAGKRAERMYLNPPTCEKDTMREQFIRDHFGASIDEEEYRRHRVRELVEAQRETRGRRVDLSFNSQSLAMMSASQRSQSQRSRSSRQSLTSKSSKKALRLETAANSDNLFIALANYVKRDEKRMYAAFEQFDKDRSGFLDMSELRTFLLSLLPTSQHSLLTDGAVDYVCLMLDANGDGRLSFDEIVTAVRDLKSLVAVSSTGSSGGFKAQVNVDDVAMKIRMHLTREITQEKRAGGSGSKPIAPPSETELRKKLASFFAEFADPHTHTLEFGIPLRNLIKRALPAKKQNSADLRRLMSALRAAADKDDDGRVTLQEFERTVLFGGKALPQSQKEPPKAESRMRDSDAMLSRQRAKGLGPYAAHTMRRPRSASPPSSRQREKMAGVSEERRQKLATTVARRREEQIRELQAVHPSQWTCSDVTLWLEAIVKLPHLKPRFAHNHIDGEMLLTMSDEVLKLDFMVLSLGQRQHVLACLEDAKSRSSSQAPRRSTSSRDVTKGSGVEGPGATRAMKLRQIHRLEKKIHDQVQTSRRLKSQCNEYAMIASEADATANEYTDEVSRLRAEVERLDRREASAMLVAGKEVFHHNSMERDSVERRHHMLQNGASAKELRAMANRHRRSRSAAPGGSTEAREVLDVPATHAPVRSARSPTRPSRRSAVSSSDSWVVGGTRADAERAAAIRAKHARSFEVDHTLRSMYRTSHDDAEYEKEKAKKPESTPEDRISFDAHFSAFAKRQDRIVEDRRNRMNMLREVYHNAEIGRGPAELAAAERSRNDELHDFLDFYAHSRGASAEECASLAAYVDKPTGTVSDENGLETCLDGIIASLRDVGAEAWRRSIDGSSDELDNPMLGALEPFAISESVALKWSSLKGYRAKRDKLLDHVKVSKFMLKEERRRALAEHREEDALEFERMGGEEFRSRSRASDTGVRLSHVNAERIAMARIERHARLRSVGRF